MLANIVFFAPRYTSCECTKTTHHKHLGMLVIGLSVYCYKKQVLSRKWLL